MVPIYTQGILGEKHSLQNLKQKAKNIDLLLIEAGYIEPTPNDFTIDQIIEIVKSSHVKKAIATHLRESNLPILKRKIKNHKNIILAKDLMKIKI